MQFSTERLSTGDDLPSGHWSHHASPCISLMYVPAAHGAHMLGPSVRETRASPGKHLKSIAIFQKTKIDSLHSK